MKIATWNVNSIRARLPNVLAWLEQAKPDVLLMQEIKCETGAFPVMEFTAAGYQVHALGQKSYNGVAIASLHPIEDVREGLPDAAGDEQARYLEATIKGVRVASLYLPNGNPVGTEKYSYKLDWMARLKRHAATLVREERCVVLGGDYNIIPAELDVYNPKVVQATMGSISRVNVNYFDLATKLKSIKLPIFGTFMEGENIYKSILPSEGIIILGNEANGISFS